MMLMDGVETVVGLVVIEEVVVMGVVVMAVL
jgi:hypothetical protein